MSHTDKNKYISFVDVDTMIVFNTLTDCFMHIPHWEIPESWLTNNGDNVKWQYVSILADNYRWNSANADYLDKEYCKRICKTYLSILSDLVLIDLKDNGVLDKGTYNV